MGQSMESWNKIFAYLHALDLTDIQIARVLGNWPQGNCGGVLPTLEVYDGETIAAIRMWTSLLFIKITPYAESGFIDALGCVTILRHSEFRRENPEHQFIHRIHESLAAARVPEDIFE